MTAFNQVSLFVLLLFDLKDVYCTKRSLITYSLVVYHHQIDSRHPATRSEMLPGRNYFRYKITDRVPPSADTFDDTATSSYRMTVKMPPFGRWRWLKPAMQTIGLPSNELPCLCWLMPLLVPLLVYLWGAEPSATVDGGDSIHGRNRISRVAAHCAYVAIHLLWSHHRCAAAVTLRPVDDAFMRVRLRSFSIWIFCVAMTWLSTVGGDGMSQRSPTPAADISIPFNAWHLVLDENVCELKNMNTRT